MLLLLWQKASSSYNAAKAAGPHKVQRLEAILLSIRERKMRTKFFLHKLFEHRQGSGISRQNSRDIPDSSLRNPRKTKFRGRARSFGHHPFEWKTPTPPGGLRTQKLNLCALFSCLINQGLHPAPLQKAKGGGQDNGGGCKTSRGWPLGNHFLGARQKGEPANGRTGFCKNLRFPAKICGFLRKSATPKSLDLQSEPKISENLQKSAKMCVPGRFSFLLSPFWRALIFGDPPEAVSEGVT